MTRAMPVVRSLTRLGNNTVTVNGVVEGHFSGSGGGSVGVEVDARRASAGDELARGGAQQGWKEGMAQRSGKEGTAADLGGGGEAVRGQPGMDGSGGSP